LRQTRGTQAGADRSSEDILICWLLSLRLGAVKTAAVLFLRQVPILVLKWLGCQRPVWRLISRLLWVRAYGWTCRLAGCEAPRRWCLVRRCCLAWSLVQ